MSDMNLNWQYFEPIDDTTNEETLWSMYTPPNNQLARHNLQPAPTLQAPTLPVSPTNLNIQDIELFLSNALFH
jgi:hypothetical protein